MYHLSVSTGSAAWKVKQSVHLGKLPALLCPSACAGQFQSAVLSQGGSICPQQRWESFMDKAPPSLSREVLFGVSMVVMGTSSRSIDGHGAEHAQGLGLERSQQQSRT